MTQFPQPGNDPCPGVPDTGHLYDLTKHFHLTLCLLKANEVPEKKNINAYYLSLFNFK